MATRLFVLLVVALRVAVTAEASSRYAITHADTRAIAASDMSIVRAACAGDVLRESLSRGEPLFGCRACPDGTTHSEGFSRKLIWSAQAITTGHFLSRDSTEAILAMSGCEPHSQNFGGSVLLTKRGDKWEKLWYEGGLITTHCKVVPIANSPDILLCEDSYKGMGEQDQSLYTVHPTQPEGKRTTIVFTVSDTLNSCVDSLKTIQRISIEQAELQSTSGQPTLRVSVRHGSRKNLTKAESAKYCKTATEAHVPSPPTRVDELQFVFDGDHFIPVPASRDLVKVLSAGQ